MIARYSTEEARNREDIILAGMKAQPKEVKYLKREVLAQIVEWADGSEFMTADAYEALDLPRQVVTQAISHGKGLGVLHLKRKVGLLAIWVQVAPLTDLPPQDQLTIDRVAALRQEFGANTFQHADVIEFLDVPGTIARNLVTTLIGRKQIERTDSKAGRSWMYRFVQ